MNLQRDTALGRPIECEFGSGNVYVESPISSPISAKTSPGKGKKRSHNTAGLGSSPGLEDDETEGRVDGKRQPGVRRACNQCRQQKVSHKAAQP